MSCSSVSRSRRLQKNVRNACRLRHQPAADRSLAARAAVAPAQNKVKLKVAVDVDEVLGRFVHTLNQYIKEEHGIVRDVSHYWIYEFAKIWHCDQDRSNEIVHAFFKSSHFNDGIPILPGALEVLQRLKEDHELVVVTSRQHCIEGVTREWLERHFPSVFSEVHFGNHFAMEGTSRKKSEICRDINAHILIDDNPRYAYDCASEGTHALLFNWNMGYPWAELTPQYMHENITVVRHWEDVEAFLAEAALTRRQSS